MSTHAVRLTPKGIAVAEFLIYDAAKLGLTEVQAYSIAEDLSDKFDGTRSMIELFNEHYEIVEGEVKEKWADTVG